MTEKQNKPWEPDEEMKKRYIECWDYEPSEETINNMYDEEFEKELDEMLGIPQEKK